MLYIVKPEAGCQGKGIFLVKNLDDLQRRTDNMMRTQKKEHIEQVQKEEDQNQAKKYQGAVQEEAENPHSELIHVEPKRQLHNNSYVVQKYLKYPALWKGHKFDFRIYVLITSVVDPMAIFLYHDGLVRLASQEYKCSNNLNDVYTHLTNYSLNKKNSQFDGANMKLKVSDVLKGEIS